MILTEKQARKQFGDEKINKLIDQNLTPTNRTLADDHEGLVEYISSISVLGGRLVAYYYQPEDADEWEYGEMNGVEYGEIEYIEYIITVNLEERKRIGKRVAELRAKRNITQRELAALADLDPANIAKIELGKYSVGFDNLQKIAEVFGMQVDFKKRVGQ